MFTCVSTFQAVDVSIPLCQIGQVNWQMIMCQLHHIAYQEEAGRTWEGRRRGVGEQLMEILQQSSFNYRMKDFGKKKVKRGMHNKIH